MPMIHVSKKGRELKLKADKAFAQQKWKKAHSLYLEASEQIPGDPRLKQRLGDVCRRLKSNNEAVEMYKEAVKIYATDGFWAKAIAISKMVLEIDPDDRSIQKKLAEMYAKQDTKGKTVQDPQLQKAVAPAAISISGMEPLKERDPRLDSFLGNTISISGATPRKT